MVMFMGPYLCLVLKDVECLSQVGVTGGDVPDMIFFLKVNQFDLHWRGNRCGNVIGRCRFLCM